MQIIPSTAAVFSLAIATTYATKEGMAPSMIDRNQFPSSFNAPTPFPSDFVSGKSSYNNVVQQPMQQQRWIQQDQQPPQWIQQDRQQWNQPQWNQPQWQPQQPQNWNNGLPVTPCPSVPRQFPVNMNRDNMINNGNIVNRGKGGFDPQVNSFNPSNVWDRNNYNMLPQGQPRIPAVIGKESSNTVNNGGVYVANAQKAAEDTTSETSSQSKTTSHTTWISLAVGSAAVVGLVVAVIRKRRNAKQEPSTPQDIFDDCATSTNKKEIEV